MIHHLTLRESWADAEDVVKEFFPGRPILQKVTRPLGVVACYVFDYTVEHPSDAWRGFSLLAPIGPDRMVDGAEVVRKNKEWAAKHPEEIAQRIEEASTFREELGRVSTLDEMSDT